MWENVKAVHEIRGQQSIAALSLVPNKGDIIAHVLSNSGHLGHMNPPLFGTT